MSKFRAIILVAGIALFMIGCASDIILPEPESLKGVYKGRYYVILNPGDNEIERYQIINFEFDDISYRMSIDTLDPNVTTFKMCKVDGRYKSAENLTLSQLHSGPQGGTRFSTCNSSDNPEGQFSLDHRGDSLILSQLESTLDGSILRRIALKRQ